LFFIRILALLGVAPGVAALPPVEQPDPDAALMLRYRDGDQQAFQSLYERHRGPLYRYLLRQCKEQATAEELAQDVWMKLIRARADYRVQARFTTYLYTLAHNRLIDYYRAHSHSAAAAFEQIDGYELATVADGPERLPERLADSGRRVEKLLALLADLPAPQREAFLLRAEAGLSLEAIAEATGVKRETAKSRLRYAVARLRQALGDE
jgi:RNA polymerase sigma-70 factor (ECF subfamily)